MFDMKKPCDGCPFSTNDGSVGLGEERIMEFWIANAFQCHKTIDYDSFDDVHKRQGEKPQQCAGLIALQHKTKEYNIITRLAIAMTNYDPSQISTVNIPESLEALIKTNKLKGF